MVLGADSNAESVQTDADSICVLYINTVFRRAPCAGDLWLCLHIITAGRPRVTGASAYLKALAAPQNALMSIKTVLVEDNKTIRDALIPTMDELGGLEVIAFAEGALEAVHMLHQLEAVWELAVVDLFLKQGSGLDVLRSHRHHPGRIVVVLSNYATKQMREDCIRLGADGVFDKSTQLDAFFSFCASQFPGHH